MKLTLAAMAVLFILPASPIIAATTLSSERARLQGFEQHQKFLVDYDREREKEAYKMEEFRRKWEEMLSAALPQYKKDKAAQAQRIDESSPQYFEDLKVKEQESQKLWKAQQEYIQEKAREERLTAPLLSEAREYGLDKEPDRVDWRKRSIYSDVATGGSSGGGRGRSRFGGGGSGSSGGGFTRPPDFDSNRVSPEPEGGDFAPPPPPPPPGEFGGAGPDFYEPDIPPPPPPPEGAFDEDIPPPIFDEPEF